MILVSKKKIQDFISCLRYNFYILASHKKCDIQGLACLEKYYTELTVQKPTESTKNGIVCDCLTSCTEIHLFVIKEEKSG